MLYKSPVYSQASGSIAGLTYSRNRGGQYVRARAIPTNPNSPRQADIRNCMANAVTDWKSLSAPARTSWETYAQNTPMTNRVGDTIYLTGQQQWIRTHTVAQYNGLDPVSLFANAPTIFDLGNTGTLGFETVSELGGNCIFSVGDTPAWAGDDGAYVAIQLGRQVNPTVNFYKTPLRSADFVPGDSTTPITSFTANYTTTWGNDPVAPGKVFARLVVLQSDGRLSTGKIVSAAIS